MIISASGYVREASGIGVLQRMLYPELCSLGLTLNLLDSRDKGSTPAARAAGVLGSFTSVPGGEALLSLVSPLPLRLQVPVVAYVHDIRWMRTRGVAGRTYRRLDFSRTMRRAARIITVSRTAGEQIAEADPKNAYKIHVVYSGPGQIDSRAERLKVPGSLVLIGGGRHKRNEEALQALLLANPAWLGTVIGVNLSVACKRMVAGDSRFSFKSNLSKDDFVATIGSAEYYLNLGVEEGFGLPYVEALALGCQVIAIDQPLTQELIQGAANLLVNGTTLEIAEQLREVVPIPKGDIATVAERFSWRDSAALIAKALHEVTN